MKTYLTVLLSLQVMASGIRLFVHKQSSHRIADSIEIILGSIGIYFVTKL